jgi:hypothetical protein
MKPPSKIEKLWESLERNKRVENFTEGESFELTMSEMEKCRYEITDNTKRMATCTTHSRSYPHGIRIHPPHLYNIVDGIVYFKSEGSWIRWFPDVALNRKNAEIGAREMREEAKRDEMLMQERERVKEMNDIKDDSPSVDYDLE